MADFGAVGKSVPPAATTAFGRVFKQPTAVVPSGELVTKRSRSLAKMIMTPTWWGSRPIGTLPLPNDMISGKVLQRQSDGSDLPLAGVRVRLHYRPNGALIAQTLSAADGFYMFKNLMPEINAYYAIAFDPDAPPPQNAVILDRLSSVANSP